MAEHNFMLLIRMLIAGIDCTRNIHIDDAKLLLMKFSRKYPKNVSFYDSAAAPIVDLFFSAWNNYR